MTFTAKARELMSRKKVSQEDVAVAIGVSQSAVSQLLAGSKKQSEEKLKVDTVPVRRAFQIARLLGVSLDWMADPEQGMRSEEDLELERDVLKLIKRLGLRRTFDRLAKLDEGGEGLAAADPSTPPSYGPPPGRTSRPGATPTPPRGKNGKSRQSSG